MRTRILSDEETKLAIQNETLWNDLYWEGVNFTFPVQLLEADGKIVGAVQGQIIDDSYYIGYIVIFNKGKGMGKIFVEMLKKEYKKIHGNSLPDAIPFWKRLGMTFLNSEEQGYYPFEYKAGA